MHRAANIAANNVFVRANGRTDMRYIIGKACSGELQCTVDDTYNRIKSQTTQLTQETIWDWAGEAYNKVILLCHKLEGLSILVTANLEDRRSKSAHRTLFAGLDKSRTRRTFAGLPARYAKREDL